MPSRHVGQTSSSSFDNGTKYSGSTSNIDKCFLDAQYSFVPSVPESNPTRSFFLLRFSHVSTSAFGTILITFNFLTSTSWCTCGHLKLALVSKFISTKLLLSSKLLGITSEFEEVAHWQLLVQGRARVPPPQNRAWYCRQAMFDGQFNISHYIKDNIWLHTQKKTTVLPLRV